jgi:hypothetical protein
VSGAARCLRWQIARRAPRKSNGASRPTTGCTNQSVDCEIARALFFDKVTGCVSAARDQFLSEKLPRKESTDRRRKEKTFITHGRERAGKLGVAFVLNFAPQMINISPLLKGKI